MKKFNVVVVSSKPEVLQLCQSYLKDFSYIEVVCHESLGAFKDWSPKRAITTLMVDLSTIFRSSLEEREFLYTIQNSIPVVRVR